MSSSRPSRFMPRSQSMSAARAGTGSWGAASAPGDYTPLSLTPPSPSARQARLMSPSHSLPEFLPVLDEASTLKAPLVLPPASYLGLPLGARPPAPHLPPLGAAGPPRTVSLYDLRRGGAFQGGAGTGGSCAAQGNRGLGQWVPHLMVFALACLVLTAATVAFAVNVVDEYDRAESGTFFQISDIHWDPLYRYHATPGSFCRRDLLAETEKPFGQYGCDSPLLLLKTALMEMAQASAHPDFVLVTGDSVAHNLTANLTLDALQKVDEAIEEAFSDDFTKRLHVVGEQELAPMEQGSVDLLDWLGQIARIWNTSLMEASDDAFDTFLRGGYYMAVLPSQAQGGPASKLSTASSLSTQTSNVAALVLNTLLYADKPGLLHIQEGSDGDPCGQLAWLEEQLHQARHWGRRVVIAGHMPPGVDTVRGEAMWKQQYEQRYMDIVLQHSDVVVGQLFGYLHRDHFNLMHADADIIISHTHSSQQKTHTRRLQLGGTGRASTRIHKGGRQQGTARAKRWGKRRWTPSSLSQPLLRLWKGQSKRLRGWALGHGHPEVIGSSSAAVLMAPSLSPILLNRPAFRLFSYDRAGLLLDYVQHTANLKLQGAEKMWEVQYGARSVYGLEALDGSDFEQLSSSFFNSSGYPTEVFNAFCELRAAGNDAEVSGGYDCCDDCPNFMRCAVEYSSYQQFLGCNQSFTGAHQTAAW